MSKKRVARIKLSSLTRFLNYVAAEIHGNIAVDMSELRFFVSAHKGTEHAEKVAQILNHCEAIQSQELLREMLKLLGTKHPLEEFAASLTDVADKLREGGRRFRDEGELLLKIGQVASDGSWPPDELNACMLNLRKTGEILKRLPRIAEPLIQVMEEMASLSRFMMAQRQPPPLRRGTL